MQMIQRQLREDGVCVLTFDRPDSPANIFDRQTLEELEGHVSVIADANLGAKALVLTSAKKSIFVAGADLKAIRQMDAAELRSFIELGQRVFQRIAELKIPTVAAIHGAALGGGCEVALACDWRVASPDPSTKIGLPETKLGILPAWGGSTRLPRLIGLPGALDIILGGKTFDSRSALRRGVIDDIARREHLFAAAQKLLARGKRSTNWKHSARVSRLLGVMTGTAIRGKLQKQTRGHYPALPKALEVVLGAAAASTIDAGLKLEREAVSELAATPEAANLIGLFFQQERAKKISVPNALPAGEMHAAAVIGAGVMGSGIAQWTAGRGVRVILRDVDADRVAAGMANAAKLCAAAVQRHIFTAREARDTMDRISPAPQEVSLRGVDLVIEAAVEKMEVKKQIFQGLDHLVREDAILATNTSALSITELAAATAHPGRVVGMHFFNPVHRMQLVEVITGRETTPEAAQRALSFVQRIGKLPVLVKDSPGFVVNRILLPYMIEAAQLFWHGASIREIDAAMLEFGMPMGPLRLTDEVGVDIAEDVARTLHAAFPDRMQVPEVLPKLIEVKWLGKKSGKGFYVHRGHEAEPNKGAVALRSGHELPLTRGELQQRMVLLMVNEAARCLEEGVAATAGDIDFAMVMGTGFAPFRGGPLRYADTVGIEVIAGQMAALGEAAGTHYGPCALIQEMARKRKRFHED